jgi:hypothetical protein
MACMVSKSPRWALSSAAATTPCPIFPPQWRPPMRTAALSDKHGISSTSTAQHSTSPEAVAYIIFVICILMYITRALSPAPRNPPNSDLDLRATMRCPAR